MNILGISAYYHDSAACLIRSGKIVAAAQEERFTRKKHDARFPTAAIDYCLNSANIISSDIDYVVYYEKPFRKFDRLLETYLTFAPKGITQALSSLPVMVKEKIWDKELGRKRPSFKRALTDFRGLLFYLIRPIGFAHIYE
jgi:carbamoyltransferase